MSDANDRLRVLDATLPQRFPPAFLLAWSAIGGDPCRTTALVDPVQARLTTCLDGPLPTLLTGLDAMAAPWAAAARPGPLLAQVARTWDVERLGIRAAPTAGGVTVTWGVRVPPGRPVDGLPGLDHPTQILSRCTTPEGAAPHAVGAAAGEVELSTLVVRTSPGTVTDALHLAADICQGVGLETVPIEMAGVFEHPPPVGAHEIVLHVRDGQIDELHIALDPPTVVDRLLFCEILGVTEHGRLAAIEGILGEPPCDAVLLTTSREEGLGLQLRYPLGA